MPARLSVRCLRPQPAHVVSAAQKQRVSLISRTVGLFSETQATCFAMRIQLVCVQTNLQSSN